MLDGRPLAFASKALSPLHLSMLIYDKEMLAVIHVVTKWRPYLIGRRFQIQTDHRMLKYLFKQKIFSMEQQKWVIKLLGYDYEIVYKKGVENLAADALSRIPKHAELHTLSIQTWPTFEFIKEEQHNDPKLQKIVQRLTHNPSYVPHHSLAMDHLHYKGWIIMAANSTHKSVVCRNYMQLLVPVIAGSFGPISTSPNISIRKG